MFKKNSTKKWFVLLVIAAVAIGCTKPDDDDDNNGGSGGNLNPTFINGKLPGLFSVSPTQQVQFSQGNLQYQASTNTWRFAEHQWDYVGGTDHGGNHFGNVDGSSNNSISPTYAGWIDLFGWGTSGWDCGNTYFRPWDTAIYGEEYGPLGNNDLTDSYAHSDWGVHNKISNGGKEAALWRTLKQNEWDYVLHQRSTTSGDRYAYGRVNNEIGIILLPDNWDNNYYELSNTNSDIENLEDFNNNVISSDIWTSSLEPNGAVFLPAAGLRTLRSRSMIYYSYNFSYWSASHYDKRHAWACLMANLHKFSGYSSRDLGFSVRLVRNTE